MGCTPDTTPPGVIPLAAVKPTVRFGVHAASTVNLALSGTSAISIGFVIDGITLKEDTLFLAAGQTAPSENGIWNMGGQRQHQFEAFNGTGDIIHTVSGGTQQWWYEKGNSTSVTGNNVLTQSGYVAPYIDGTITIHGPASQPWTGYIRPMVPMRPFDFDQGSEYDLGMQVSVDDGGTAHGGHLFQQTSPSNPQVNTDPITFVDAGVWFISLSAYVPTATPPDVINACP